jgi:hypothetical protein
MPLTLILHRVKTIRQQKLIESILKQTKIIFSLKLQSKQSLKEIMTICQIKYFKKLKIKIIF